MGEESTEMGIVDHLRVASASVETAIDNYHESDGEVDTKWQLKHAFARGQLHVALGIIKSVIEDES